MTPEESLEQPENIVSTEVTDEAEELQITLEVEYTNRINFAMQQHNVPLVEMISLTNTSEMVLMDLQLTISLENGECNIWTGRIASIAPGDIYRIEPHDLRLNAAELAQRTELERTMLQVEVRSGYKQITTSYPIELLTFDQWPGVAYYPELIASFVTPNHPRIAEILAIARKSLGDLSGNDAIDGYQAGNRSRAVQISESCFNAVLTLGIGYINPPASFDRDGQRVRLVDRICRESFGSCLDLSLLLASLWEQAGLHPLILLMEGHAMPAVWTHDSHLPESAIDEAARIRNLIELGEIVPVESTLVTQTTGAIFSSAVDVAKKKMQAPGAEFCAIDIRSGRKRGVQPLPLRFEGMNTTIELNVQDAERIFTDTNTTLDSVTLADRVERIITEEYKYENTAETSNDRINRWQTRLLDLSLRNRLINFRKTGTTLCLRVPDVAMLEDLLADENQFYIYPKTDENDTFLKQELSAKHLYSTESLAETQTRLLQLYRTARLSIDETGANLLYLSIGMLKWFESKSSDTPRYAPLIMLPVKLFRHSTGSGYRYDLSLSEEPLRPNVTLLEKLRTQFGIDTTGLDNLPEDEHGLDVPLILRNFRLAIRDSIKWEVEESVYLGLFSFNKFLMWRDLQENMEQLRQNRLVRHLIDRNQDEFDPVAFPNPDNLDDEIKPSDLTCTRDADSTQLAAVRAAAENRSFVLEGPPGTGKSQTIANIIADSLNRGKRVLFVAEKMAALTVVRRRLEEDGLGPFCLELHSAKASKKEVLSQLEDGLDAVRLDVPGDWTDLCRDVENTRNQLNSYVRSLHERHVSGDTLYEVLGRLCLLGEGLRVEIPADDIKNITMDELKNQRQQIAKLVEIAEGIDFPSKHPLRGIGRSEWSFTLPEEVRNCLERTTAAVDQIDKYIADYFNSVGVETGILSGISYDSIQALAVIVSLSVNSPGPNVKLLTGPDAVGLLNDLQQFIKLGKQRDNQKSEILKYYLEEILDIDPLIHINAVKSAQGLPGPLRWFWGYFAGRKLKPYCTGKVPKLDILRADLDTIREIKITSSQLASPSMLSQVLGHLWNAGNADWLELEKLLQWCVQFRKAADVIKRESNRDALIHMLAKAACKPANNGTLSTTAKLLVKAWKAWLAAWGECKQLLNTSSAQAFSDSPEAGWIQTVKEVLARWYVGIPELNNWCAWQRIRASAVEFSLLDLIERYENGELLRTQLIDVFERSFGEKWFTTVANSTTAIRDFNAVSHTKTIDRFRTLDKNLIVQTQLNIAAQLGANAPKKSSQASGQSEMGILRRELEKKRRHLPTRRLIETIPNLLSHLKPCFLMSPLSVAQYLDTKLPLFDLVVFDEASQIPVWDSIGAIARGTEVIVVGDSKQLPPTNFFSTVDGENDESNIENLAVEDMESILKECNASGIPAMRLCWHYRSRHESLIAFSNHHYYNNLLHTFPSPEECSAQLGVSYRYISNGVYDRGGSRTNKIEAEAVVDEVIQLLLNPDVSKSIGIVTFNQTQQSWIEDLLDAKRRNIPEIEEYFTNDVKEPVFVKNLENVQGDERDTIIFSICNGPDQTGKPSMNFGPLNKDGGERRLNVAITRARCRLIVFSSLRSEQIDLKRTQSVGVKHLKTFLDYADRGPKAIAEAIDYSGTREFESGFEHAVWQALIKRGYEVDTQVGCAGYRVDLAVRDPDNPGRYLIGIECDGAAYHSAKTARDRDRLRQSVLEGLGWQIERIWSTEWWVNSEHCISSIITAIDYAKINRKCNTIFAETDSSVYNIQSNYSEHDQNTIADQKKLYAKGPDSNLKHSIKQPVSSNLNQYKLATPGKRRLSHLDIYDLSNTSVLTKALMDIVEIEGPIAHELIIRRLAEWFGGKRITSRFRDRIKVISSIALQSEEITLEADIYWPDHLSAKAYTTFRIPGIDKTTQRDIEHIPIIEQINAVVHIVREQYGLSREDLERETVKLLGISRLTSRIKEMVSDSINTAIEQKYIIINDGWISLNIR